MKLFLVGLLFFSSTFSFDEPPCDELQFEITVINTTQGLDNGKIEISLKKRASNVKANLFGDRSSKNRIGVKINELTKLSSGTYILILQNDKCFELKKDIVIQ